MITTEVVVTAHLSGRVDGGTTTALILISTHNQLTYVGNYSNIVYICSNEDSSQRLPRVLAKSRVVLVSVTDRSLHILGCIDSTQFCNFRH